MAITPCLIYVNIAVDWFTATWTNNGYNPDVLRKPADDNVLFKYPLHGERHGVEEVIEALEALYTSFPDLDFHVEGDIISDGKYVAAKWTGGGTHTGIAFSDNPFKTEIPANMCGRNKDEVYRMEYHHENYDTPTKDLIPLCSGCHIKFHKRYIHNELSKEQTQADKPK